MHFAAYGLGELLERPAHLVGHCLGECGVVDVSFHLNNLDLRRQVFFQRVYECGVGFGVINAWPGRSE